MASPEYFQLVERAVAVRARAWTAARAAARAAAGAFARAIATRRWRLVRIARRAFAVTWTRGAHVVVVERVRQRGRLRRGQRARSDRRHDEPTDQCVGLRDGGRHRVGRARRQVE